MLWGDKGSSRSLKSLYNGCLVQKLQDESILTYVLYAVVLLPLFLDYTPHSPNFLQTSYNASCCQLDKGTPLNVRRLRHEPLSKRVAFCVHIVSKCLVFVDCRIKSGNDNIVFFLCLTLNIVAFLPEIKPASGTVDFCRNLRYIIYRCGCFTAAGCRRRVCVR